MPISANIFEFYEPVGPKIIDIQLFITIQKGGIKGVNKNSGSGYDIKLTHQYDEKNVIFNQTNIDSDKEYLWEHGQIQVELNKSNIRNITASECRKFKVLIKADENLDGVWRFTACIVLIFQDKSKIESGELLFELTAGKSVENISNAIYEPPKYEIIDDSIKQRFEFTGNQIEIANCDKYLSLPNLQGYYFHYYNVQDIDGEKQFHSLQASVDGLPTLLEKPPFFDDNINNNISKIILDGQEFSFNLIINKQLGQLNSDNLDDFFNYYLSLKQNPTTISFAFGRYDNEKIKAFHELKQPFSLYNWEVLFHAPMQLVEHRKRQFKHTFTPT